MRVPVRGLWASPRIVVSLTLLIALSLLPRTTRAGCSAHYIKHHLDSLGGLARLELLGLDGVAPTAPVEAPAAPSTPCSGVFCSGNPAVPAPPAPMVPSLTRSEVTLADSLRLEADRGVFRGRPVAAVLRPITLSLGIFHPPR